VSITNPQAAIAACFCEDTRDLLRLPPYKRASRIFFDGGPTHTYCARRSGEIAVPDRAIVPFSVHRKGGDSLAWCIHHGR
jgi:hypothetical protein